MRVKCSRVEKLCTGNDNKSGGGEGGDGGIVWKSTRVEVEAKF